MSLFSRRKKGYRAGVILLIFAFGIFSVGFVAPYWKTLYSADQELGMQSFDEGLWMYCVSEEYSDDVTSTCMYAGPTERDAWFLGVRILVAFSFVGHILSGLYAVRINCYRVVDSPRRKTLEIMAAVSGLMGFAGCMLYLAYQKSGAHGHMVLIQGTHHVNSAGPYNTHFYWAFYMTAVGSALSTLAAMLIFIFNHDILLTSLPVPYAGSWPKGEGLTAIIAVTTMPPPRGEDGQQHGYGYSYGYGYPATFEPVGTSY